MDIASSRCHSCHVDKFGVRDLLRDVSATQKNRSERWATRKKAMRDGSRVCGRKGRSLCAFGVYGVWGGSAESLTLQSEAR